MSHFSDSEMEYLTDAYPCASTALRKIAAVRRSLASAREDPHALPSVAHLAVNDVSELAVSLEARLRDILAADREAMSS